MVMQEWFADAKLGIFIHWGVYAVDGTAESWAFYTGEVTREEYYSQHPRWKPDRYDPEAWASLFERAGAKYAVLTSKHHDGVALWDAPEAPLTAGRDLIGPYAQALRGHGLRVGLYFSLADWSHPDYRTATHRAHDGIVDEITNAPAGGDDPERWARFVGVYQSQVRDLIDRYQPDLLWFDGEWERTDEQWGLRTFGDEIAPKAILNGRFRTHADYATPEQSLPVSAPDGPWELCLTLNESWGYRQSDTKWKSVRQLVRYFVETISLGGNLLLDVGPEADGTIPREAVERLTALGRWIEPNAAAIYGTRAGLPAGYFHGPTTLSEDRRTLYLFCFDAPREFVSLRGLLTEVTRVTVVGTGEDLPFQITGGLNGHPGHLWIAAPTQVDDYATVLAVDFGAPVSLYTASGRDEVDHI